MTLGGATSCYSCLPIAAPPCYQRQRNIDALKDQCLISVGSCLESEPGPLLQGGSTTVPGADVAVFLVLPALSLMPEPELGSVLFLQG